MNRYPDRTYVWTWLPGETEPVVAASVEQDGPLIHFVYAASYLDRPDAISLNGHELPLKPGIITPLEGLNLAGTIRDGSPDAWGRSIIRDLLHPGEEDDIPEIGYLLESGSNRFGANDFQENPDRYIPRTSDASLDELVCAATRFEEGRSLNRTMAEALVQATTIGGARPKVLVYDPDGTQWIVKLPSTSDRVFSAVNAEATCLELARRAGLRVPDSRVTVSNGRPVLLVRRFDRADNAGRRHVVSGLTMVGLDEMQGRYATYPALLHQLQTRGADPDGVGAELFERIAFSIAIGNSDDHARNHAAFWDGHHLNLTPAYDLTPGPRSGETATQAMAYDTAGTIRQSSFATLLTHAHVYGLTDQAARDKIDHLVASIRDNWNDAADIGELNDRDRDRLSGLQILNPAVLYDY